MALYNRDINDIFLDYVRDGLTNEVRTMVNDSKININYSDKYGETPLRIASSNNYIDIVKLLLEKGADINLQNSYGNIALMQATYRGFVEIVKLLLENINIDVNLQDNYGRSALMWASYRGYVKILKLLLENGAYVHLQYCGGKNAIHLAREQNHTEIVKILENQIRYYNKGQKKGQNRN